MGSRVFFFNILNTCDSLLIYCCFAARARTDSAINNRHRTTTTTTDPNGGSTGHWINQPMAITLPGRRIAQPRQQAEESATQPPAEIPKHPLDHGGQTEKREGHGPVIVNWSRIDRGWEAAPESERGG